MQRILSSWPFLILTSMTPSSEGSSNPIGLPKSSDFCALGTGPMAFIASSSPYGFPRLDERIRCFEVICMMPLSSHLACNVNSTLHRSQPSSHEHSYRLVKGIRQLHTSHWDAARLYHFTPTRWSTSTLPVSALTNGTIPNRCASISSGNGVVLDWISTMSMAHVGMSAIIALLNEFAKLQKGKRKGKSSMVSLRMRGQ